jgi:predicted ATP-dependent serine protease
MDRPSLYGREREEAVIRRVLDELRNGGCAVVVEGEAGIGKSALLSEATAEARARGMLVLSGTGVRTEARSSGASSPTAPRSRRSGTQCTSREIST